MREIKFRGKRFVGGVWEIGWYLQREGNYGETLHFIYDGEHEHLVVPETVGQYAGRKTVVDEKEIYQGDILSFVRASYDGSSQGVETGYVEWSDDASSWIVRESIESAEEEWMYLILHNDDGVEIIGNIHDHPHLLKGEEK